MSTLIHPVVVIYVSKTSKESKKDAMYRNNGGSPAAVFVTGHSY